MQTNQPKQNNQKIKTAVIFGGYSSEYSVSLQSATAVLQNLDPEKYELVPVGITKAGDWFYYTGAFSKIQEDTWHLGNDCIPAALSPVRNSRCLLLFEKGGVRRLAVDLVFPVLHGKNGEDGTVQGAAALAGIPLAGCGVLASALCMDKDRAHRLVEAAGVRVPRAFVLKAGTDGKKAQEFAAQTGYPVFVKPVKAGSSYGISKVGTPENLHNALVLAFQYDSEVIVEEAIDGFEVGCAVLGNDVLVTGEVDEIELSGGFFDFTEKYTLKTSAIHVPARIDPVLAETVKKTAKVIYRALGCSGFARVDCFITPQGGIVFNEVNTIPGFTEHSRYPGMMQAAGYSFREMLDRIVALALEEEGNR
ncbi:MAG: D-alanine--D-serine ligase VanG [Eubacterium sp.]|jgi:D-alanine--D-alanine ligase|nr:D-alanine--D-serine ligase VanG [Eubacterium sp.]